MLGTLGAGEVVGDLRLGALLGSLEGLADGPSLGGALGFVTAEGGAEVRSKRFVEGLVLGAAEESAKLGGKDISAE